MLECISGEHLLEDFRDASRSSIKNAVLKLSEEDTSLELHDISALARNLLEWMINTSPKLRYKAHEALKHPWITGEHSAPIPWVFSQQIADQYEAIENFSRLQKFMMIVAYLKKTADQVKYVGKPKNYLRPDSCQTKSTDLTFQNIQKPQETKQTNCSDNDE